MSEDGEPPRLRALDVPRHTCNHSSACCSSYAVGPLLPDDLVRARTILPRVREAFPDQDLTDPFVQREHQGAVADFLNKRDGYCVFWRSDVGCSIHATVGGASKPLVCQLFPLQLVETEGGLRIGVRPTCLSDHASWADAPPVDGAFIERLVRDRRSFLKRTEPDGEDVILRLLSLPDLDTGSALSFLAGRTRDDVPDIEAWLEARLQGVLSEVDAIGAVGPIHPATSTAQVLTRFRAWLSGRSDPGSWPEVPPPGLPYLRDAMRRLVFLRQTTLHPTLAWALLAYVAAARWAGAWAAADDSGYDAERMGRGFSTLLIVLENPRLQRGLVEAGAPFDAAGESPEQLGGPSAR